MLNQLLILIWEHVSEYYRMLGTFKEPLDFLPMGEVMGKVEFPTYLTRVLDLTFVVSSGVLVFGIILFILGFSFLLFAGGC